ncbi:MAG: hypothetical protein WA584_19590 [Pyrinomonadaceae bacterium]
MIKLPDNPYPGLRCFEYSDRFLFFGRKDRNEELLKKLQANNFVAVVGTSGSGKSSLVRAGLVPLLHGGLNNIGSHWRISICKPGDNPIQGLAKALWHPENFDEEIIEMRQKNNASLIDEEETENEQKNLPAPTPIDDELKLCLIETLLRQSEVGLKNFANGELLPDENLLIVIDQFEELFRFKEKSERRNAGEEAAAFVKLLLKAVADESSRIYVVITMRSDYLGDCSQFRDLPEAINKGQYLIPRLTRDQLSEAIEKPARVYGSQMLPPHIVQITPHLVKHLLNSIGDDQDQLPVLQHALMRTWKEWLDCRKPDEPISIDNYNKVEGMESALSKHAKEAFAELTPRQQRIAEKMFKRLTEKDSENREKRRPVKIREICAVVGAGNARNKKNVFDTIKVFCKEGRTFLIPSPPGELTEETMIDISHESLIRIWGDLKGWVKEEVDENAWQYRRLAADTLLLKKFEARNTHLVGTEKYEEDYKDFLWRGLELKDALNWKKKHKPNAAWSARYQELSDEESLKLAELSRSAPGIAEEVDKERQNFIEQHFEEAMAFLKESKDNEVRELEERERYLQFNAREKYYKKLIWATALAAILFLVATVAAFTIFWKNQELADTQNNLKTQYEKLQRTNKELEEAQKAVETKINELNTQNDELKKTQNELKDKREELEKLFEKEKGSRRTAEIERRRADEKASLAIKNEKDAKKAKDDALANAKALATAKTEIEQAKAETDKVNAVLELNRLGSVFAEAGEFDQAKNKFDDYLKNYNSDCEKTKSCTEQQALGKWWGQHNIGTVNSQLGNFKDAQDSFSAALGTLENYQALIIKPAADSKESMSAYFLPISFKQQQQQQTSSEEIKKSKIITLRKYAQFLRSYAENPTRFSNEQKEIAEWSLDDKSKWANEIAARSYENLLRLKEESDENRLYIANIKKELADTYFVLKQRDYGESNYRYALDVYLDKKQPIFLSNSVRKKLFEISLLNMSKVEDIEVIEGYARDIVGAMRTSLSASAGNNVLYDKSMADTYSDLAVSYRNYSRQKTEEFQDKINDLRGKATEKNNLKTILNEFENYGRIPKEMPDDLASDDIELLNEINNDYLLTIEMDKRANSLSNLSDAIKSFGKFRNINDDSSWFEPYETLAMAYLGNNEACNAMSVISDVDKLSDNLYSPSPKYINGDDLILRLSVLRGIADFYESNYSDTDMSAKYYDAIVKELDEVVSLASFKELEDVEKIKSVRFYFQVGRYFYLHGNYVKANANFTKYRDYLRNNAEVFDSAKKNSNASWDEKDSYNIVFVEILVRETLGDKENIEDSIKKYNDLLDKIEIQKSKKASTAPGLTNVNSNSADRNAAVNNAQAQNVLSANSNISAANSSKDKSLDEFADLSYEVYLRIALANLYLAKNDKAKAQHMLSSVNNLSLSTTALRRLPTFIVEKYAANLKKLGDFLHLESQDEQARTYYQGVIQILKYFRNERMIIALLEIEDDSRLSRYYKGGINTYSSRALTKEYYNDYIISLKALKDAKDESLDFNILINSFEAIRDKITEVKAVEKPECVLDETKKDSSKKE